MISSVVVLQVLLTGGAEIFTVFAFPALIFMHFHVYVYFGYSFEPFTASCNHALEARGFCMGHIMLFQFTGKVETFLAGFTEVSSFIMSVSMPG